MVVNFIDMLQKAKKEHYAVPHFNINNLEWAKYVLEECNEKNVPVILGVSEGAAKYMGGFDTIYGMVTGLIKDLDIKIPVCLHVDHGQSFDTCKKAIDAGFKSVMIDASKHPLKENIEITKKVVDAEIDALAPALGSVHGIYKGEPNLDFETMKKIDDTLPIPLVLHGGSGIDEEKIQKAISCGISKININTELQQAWTKGVREKLDSDKEVYDPRKVIGAGEKNLKEMVDYKLSIFNTRL